MFNGKSRQMRIRHQIGDSLAIHEQLFENRPVSLRRPNDSCTGLIQPALDSSQCLFEGKRVLEDPWIGPDPNKCGQNRPAQADNSAPGQPAIPPCTCPLVMGVKSVFSVQKDIGIDEDQRESSPSIWAKSS